MPFRKSDRGSGVLSIAHGVDRVFRDVIVMIAVAALALTTIFVYLVAAIRPEQGRYRTAAGTLALAHAAMLGEESGLRGYLLVRDRRMLDTYRQSAKDVADDFGALDEHIGSDRQLAPLLLRMRVAAQAWESEWVRAVLAGNVPSDTQAAEDFFSRGDDLFEKYRVAESALSQRVQARRDELYFQQDRLLAAGLVTTLVLAAFVIVMANRQSRRLKDAVVAPVHSILAATESIARLELDVPLEPSGPAEFQRIGEGINRMRDALSDSLYQELAAQERVEAQSDQLRAILAMSREISGSLNLGYVLEAVATAATTISRFPRVVIWLTDDDGGRTLSGVYDSTTGHGVPEEDLKAELGIGVVGQAVRYGRTATTHELGEPTVEVNLDRPLRTVAVPLIVGARIAGAIEASSPTPRFLAPDSLDVLETLASHAAAAIEAASLHTYTAELAHTDGLTGLANRRLLDHDLALECERSARYGRPLALIMFDLDHFKRLNDTYGHTRGDEVLQQLAGVVSREVRSTDTVYRYGGEEFAVLVREAGAEEAQGLAERLRSRVEEHFAARGALGPVTASFGIGLVPPLSPVPAEVVGAADAALYWSKAQGRNRVTLRPGRPAAAESPSTAP
jgi:diguanylate cyclase (GGDEF)-like protein